MKTGDTSVEVVLDGESAKVYRITALSRRRWFGLLPDRTDVTRTVIGIYPCAMSLEMEHSLNKTGRLSMTLNGGKIVLHDRLADLAIIEGRG